MKKYISLLLAVLVTVFTVNSFALEVPPKPDNGLYVVDQANKLSEDQKKALNTKIDGINKNTKNEFGVLLIQTLDGDNLEDFSQKTIRSWGVGKVGLNNGILLVISVGDRKTRLQTGKGVEGDLPDLRARDILDNNLRPYLKKGDFAGGINSTIDATSSYLESRSAVPVPAKSETSSLPAASSVATTSSSGNGFVIFLLVMLLGGGLIGLIAYFISRSNRKEREAIAIRQAAEERAYDILRADALRRREAKARAERAVRITTPNYTGTSHSQSVISATAIGLGAAAAVAGVAGTAVAISALSRDDEAKKRKKREEEQARQAEADARKRREEDEAAAKRRRDEESSNYSSHSSSSSYDSGSSSYDSGSSSSYDSGGGGFGGGDSGGGGASSDW